MPTASAADLREELLARVWEPTRRAALHQDAELKALEALEAAGALASPPSPEEMYGPVPDLECGPPSGDEEWLADLPAELLDEYIAATEDSPCREAIVAGRLPRQPGDGCGFASGGVADELPPGPVLAGLAGDAWAAGLDGLGDDELIGVLRAARRLRTSPQRTEKGTLAAPFTPGPVPHRPAARRWPNPFTGNGPGAVPPLRPLVPW